jgi:hypothetical protein
VRDSNSKCGGGREGYTFIRKELLVTGRKEERKGALRQVGYDIG